MKFVLAFLLVGLAALPVIYSQSYMPTAQADSRSVRTERTERVHSAATFPVAPTTTAQVATAVKSARATVVAKPVAAVSAPKVVEQPAAAAKAVTQAPAPKPAATTVAAPAKQTVAPSSDFARAVELEIFKLINAERTKAGLSTLVADTRLDAIARAHSKDMLSKGYFSHTNKAGCSSSCRVTAAGYSWQATGENIYTMDGYDLSAKDTARHMVEGWMNSPGHRANILKGMYTNHGIGLAVSGKTIYATSVFSTPL